MSAPAPDRTGSGWPGNLRRRERCGGPRAAAPGTSSRARADALWRAIRRWSGQPRGTTKQTHVGPTRQFSGKRAGNPNPACRPRVSPPAGAASPRGPGLRAGLGARRGPPATGCTITSSTPYVAASSRDPAPRARSGRADHPAACASPRRRSRCASGTLDLLGLLDQALRRPAARRCAARPSPAAAAAPAARPPPAVAATTALTVRKVRGSAQLGRGPERRAVELERLGGAAAGEVVGEDVGQALLGGQPGRVVRGARAARSSGTDGRGRGGPQRVGAAADAEADARRAPSSRARCRRTPGSASTASSLTPPAPWRSAQLVTGSVPGARPMPRSIRPG